MGRPSRSADAYMLMASSRKAVESRSKADVGAVSGEERPWTLRTTSEEGESWLTELLPDEREGVVCCVLVALRLVVVVVVVVLKDVAESTWASSVIAQRWPRRAQ